MRRRLEFDEGAKGFMILLLLSQLFFSNGGYLFFGAICLWIILYNLQQPFKPTVFSIIFIFHFIQVAAGIWESNYLDQDINYRSDFTDTATIVGFVGLIFLFAPIIYFQDKIPAVSRATLLRHAEKLSINKTFRAYLIAFFVMNALAGVAFVVGGLAQVIFSLINIKWFLFLLFGFQSILKNQRRKEFYFFAALEFLSGFYSYFSDFKTIIFFLVFLYLCLLVTVSLKQMIVVVLALGGLFFAGVLWTSVKGEYRQFLNQGSRSQTVQVEKSDALDKLLELSDKQDAKTFNGAVADFLDRFQYTYHLAKTMERVPSVIPYQEGKNWGETISFVLTPRILNPNKPNYDASIKATKYTGIRYAGARQGTSVSLGYFADGYIDFGLIGMFVPLLILGFIYGKSYFYFVRKSSNNFLFNYAVVGALYMEFFAFEMDSTFLLGRLFAGLLTFFMLKHFFFPRLIKYLAAPAVVPAT
ncbi:MAG: hypothetical protein JWQ27_161 [Ferruginibacter sp.]|nr:hypothetical protein [Ferruginibacter sp.]